MTPFISQIPVCQKIANNMLSRFSLVCHILIGLVNDILVYKVNLLNFISSKVVRPLLLLAAGL